MTPKPPLLPWIDKDDRLFGAKWFYRNTDGTFTVDLNRYEETGIDAAADGRSPGEALDAAIKKLLSVCRAPTTMKPPCDHALNYCRCAVEDIIRRRAPAVGVPVRYPCKAHRKIECQECAPPSPPLDEVREAVIIEAEKLVEQKRFVGGTVNFGPLCAALERLRSKTATPDAGKENAK